MKSEGLSVENMFRKNSEGKKIDYEGAEEVNLLDLVILLLKYKWLILCIVLLTTVVAFAYLNLSAKTTGMKGAAGPQVPIFYYSECLIEPYKNVIEKFVEIGAAEKYSQLVLGPNFALHMVEENHLLNDIQKAILNEKKQDGRTEELPSSREVYGWLRRNLILKPSGSVLSVGFVSPEKNLPPRILNGYLFSLSEYFRRRDLESLVAKEKLLRGHLAAAEDSSLKARLAEEIFRIIDKKIRARSEKYYGFELLDPPSLIDGVKIIQKGNEKQIEILESLGSPTISKTKSWMLLLLAILASLVVGVTLAFSLEYIRNMKRHEPDKVALLKRYLSIRSKRR
jgi:hypothetical protein